MFSCSKLKAQKSYVKNAMGSSLTRLLPFFLLWTETVYYNESTHKFRKKFYDILFSLYSPRICENIAY